MSEPEECLGCGMPPWTCEVQVVRVQQGQPTKTISSYKLCEACADRAEGTLSLKVAVHVGAAAPSGKRSS